jgi:hypothetical protein
MKISVHLTEEDIRRIISTYIVENFGVNIPPDKLDIEVKSKQNYKSEWESAAIRLEVLVDKGRQPS